MFSVIKIAFYVFKLLNWRVSSNSSIIDDRIRKCEYNAALFDSRKLGKEKFLVY